MRTKNFVVKASSVGATVALLTISTMAPSNAFRLENDHDNGDHVFSLNQTDQKAIIGAGGLAAAAILGGLSGLSAVVGPYVTDAGLCPDNQSRYISYRTTSGAPHDPGAIITGTWCHE